MKCVTSVIKLIPAVAIALSASTAFAGQMPQEDGAKAMKSAVSKKTVNATCSNGTKVKVTYGFNRQGLPTYAQAYLNGKTRFMPVNLYRTDAVGTVFGDDNNFSLYSGVITSKNYRQAVNIQDPASEFIGKNCRVR
ncbi:MULTISPECIES: spore coat protein U domain-containing protein [unclassified Moraxella]|uniref:spore coat protein U domain-containing protein n=1 Tax=unclassified Moraxella TaxID=2685852 RepID=UPI003AF9B1F6